MEEEESAVCNRLNQIRQQLFPKCVINEIRNFDTSGTRGVESIKC